MLALVAVIGGSQASEAEVLAAETVGKALASAGAVLLCGGGGGVMEAACRGAKSQGGLTVGILPGRLSAEANPYVDIAITTGLGEARNAVIARSARAVVAIGGSYGTLSEIAFAVKFGVPVVGLGTWAFGQDGHPEVPILRATSAEDAAAKALSEVRLGGVFR